MKKLFYVFAFVGALMLTACEGEKNVWTDGTKLWPACEDGGDLFGFINADGKMVISPKFTITSSFSCGWCKVTEAESDKYDNTKDAYFIDKNGKSANAPEVDYATAFVNDRITFTEGDKKGKMDTDFKTVIPAEYVTLGTTAANGYCSFRENSGDPLGYLDKNGKIVIQPDFNSTSTFSNGIAVVGVKDGDDWKYGIINEKGEYIVEPQKKALSQMGEGLVSFKGSNDKYGLWDKKGNEVLAATYDNIEAFSCGLALVKKNGKYGAINTKGELVIPCNYAYMFGFYDNCTWASKDDISGYLDGKMTWVAIDTKGNQLFKLKDGDRVEIMLALADLTGFTYTNFMFHNGLAYVYNVNTKENKYIDKEGKKVYSWSGVTKAPAYNPTIEDFEKANRAAMMMTEYAPLFEGELR